MEKIITIYDYGQNPREIIISDFEEVKSISCRVISGDEVLTVYYKDGSEKTFDAYQGKRTTEYNDGIVSIPLDKVDDLSTIPDSYDMLEHFGDDDAKLRVGIESLGDLVDILNGKGI